MITFAVEQQTTLSSYCIFMSTMKHCDFSLGGAEADSDDWEKREAL